MAGDAELKRRMTAQVFALTTALGTTAEIETLQWASGSIHIPTGSSITSLTFYGATKLYKDQLTTFATNATNNGYTAMYDIINNAVTMTVAANRNYPLPALCFYMGAVKIVVDVAGSVDIALKS